MTGPNLACATILVPRPAPKPELAAMSEKLVEKWKSRV